MAHVSFSRLLKESIYEAGENEKHGTVYQKGMKATMTCAIMKGEL